MHLKSQKAHEKDVQDIQIKIKSHQKKPIALSKNALTSNTTRNASYKKKTFQVNCSALKGILAIDKEAGIATVEPGITIRDLCKATLHYNLIPLVVPEFETITVGGAIMGAALESSSYLYGQFNDTCIEYHLLLGNGEIVRASAEENSDLFYGISGSYGSLGILILVKLRLVAASSHVHITYHSFNEPKKAFDFFKQIPSTMDFVEGVVTHADNFLIMTGKKIDVSKEKPFPEYHQKNHWHTWFYQHITSNPHKEEIMPLKDYLFRYNQGAFWMGRYLMKIRLVAQALLKLNLNEMKEKMHELSNHLAKTSGPSFFMRFFFSWVFRSQYLYKLFHRVPKEFSENLFMIQDFYLPYPQIEEAFKKFREKVGVFPIWLCPVKATTTPQFLSPHYLKDAQNPFSHFLNVGFYGIPHPLKNIPELTKELEMDLEDVKGRKMLYSHSFFSKNFFGEVYDLEYYFFLRKKYHADLFRTLYQKIIS